MSLLKTVRKKNRSTTTKARGKIAPLASDARVAATSAAATAGMAAVTAAGTAAHAATHAAGTAKHWAAPRVDTAVHQAARGVDTAVDWAGPRVETAKESAKDWAAPRVEHAKDWAAPRVESARGWVEPKVADALAASEPVRKEAMSRGTAAVAALKGELAPPASSRIGAGPAPRSSGSAFGRRLGQFLMLLGLSGGAFAGWRTWSAKQRSEPEPWSPPTATPQSVRPIGSARTPYHPPAPTTPDSPATVTHISSSGRNVTSSSTPATGTSSGLGGGLGDVGAPQSHDIAGASPDEAIADSTAAIDEGRKP